MQWNRPWTQYKFDSFTTSSYRLFIIKEPAFFKDVRAIFKKEMEKKRYKSLNYRYSLSANDIHIKNKTLNSPARFATPPSPIPPVSKDVLCKEQTGKIVVPYWHKEMVPMVLP